MDRDELLRILRAFEDVERFARWITGTPPLSNKSSTSKGIDMPVEKFRSIEEMNAAPVRGGRQDGFERFVRHCARFWKLAPRRFPRGVVRFRSYEDAQATPADVRKD